MSNYNAVISRNNKVIGYTTESAGRIEVAGAIALDGSPVNTERLRVSASKRNRAKICNEMPSTVRQQHNGAVFFVLIRD